MQPGSSTTPFLPWPPASPGSRRCSPRPTAVPLPIPGPRGRYGSPRLPPPPPSPGSIARAGAATEGSRQLPPPLSHRLRWGGNGGGARRRECRAEHGAPSSRRAASRRRTPPDPGPGSRVQVAAVGDAGCTPPGGRGDTAGSAPGFGPRRRARCGRSVPIALWLSARCNASVRAGNGAPRGLSARSLRPYGLFPSFLSKSGSVPAAGLDSRAAEPPRGAAARGTAEPCRGRPALPRHAMSCRAMPCRSTPCRAVPRSAMLFRSTPFHSTPLRSVPFRTVPFHAPTTNVCGSPSRGPTSTPRSVQSRSSRRVSTERSPTPMPAGGFLLQPCACRCRSRHAAPGAPQGMGRRAAVGKWNEISWNDPLAARLRAGLPANVDFTVWWARKPAATSREPGGGFGMLGFGAQSRLWAIPSARCRPAVGLLLPRERNPDPINAT